MRLRAAGFLSALSLFLASTAFGYVYETREGARWPGPAIAIVVKLGSPGRTLQDGSLSFDQSVERAMMLWNQQIANAQFTWTEAARTSAPGADGVTTISFESKIYGQSFGQSTVAITMVTSSGTRILEADMAFNSQRVWDSFFGPLADQRGEDIHRIALHELGHVLGLDHPDQKGQIVPAIMNANVSDIDQLQPDDVNGARSLYNSPSSPAPLNRNGHLGNLSTRVRVGTGDSVMIGGFIVRDAAKQVLVRALGPSLPLADTLADPVLELHDENGAIIASNSNWKDTQQQAIEGSTVPPSNDFEAAIVATLAPGGFTAIVSGNRSTSGVATVEVYDLTAASGRLANISTRGNVGIANNVMIAGFIVVGPEGKQLVVRGLGPSLNSKLPGALPDTTLELRNGNGALLTSNTGWENGSSQIAVYGLGLSDPAESAIIRELVPGNYTAILKSPTGATGIGLIEVYDVSP